MQTFQQRVAEIFADQKPDLTQQYLADIAGVSKGLVNQWLNGPAKSMSYDAAYKISARYGYAIDWLMKGLGPKIDEGARSSTLSPIRTWEHEDDLPPGDYAYIARLDVHLSAGGGRDQIEITFVTEPPQAFRADWIRKQRLKPKHLASMEISGDSMEPRIFHGDTAIVDTSQTEVLDGKVYALWYDGGERVKRLFRRPGGGLIIHSDNMTKYPPMTMTPEECEHIRIIGRVVHVQGTGGL